jgi:hypothetical protein
MVLGTPLAFALTRDECLIHNLETHVSNIPERLPAARLFAAASIPSQPSKYSGGTNPVQPLEIPINVTARGLTPAHLSSDLTRSPSANP